MLEFRLLNDHDIPLVESWLYKEHVRKWYEIPHLGVSIDDWIFELKERNNQFHWLTHLIVLMDEKPIGMCQYYKCENSDDEDFGSLDVVGAYGIDYLIGDERYIGKGLGKEMITKLTEKLFALPDTQRITADIDKENKASESTLLSCGFVEVDKGKSRFVLDKKR